MTVKSCAVFVLAVVPVRAVPLSSSHALLQKRDALSEYFDSSNPYFAAAIVITVVSGCLVCLALIWTAKRIARMPRFKDERDFPFSLPPHEGLQRLRSTESESEPDEKAKEKERVHAPRIARPNRAYVRNEGSVRKNVNASRGDRRVASNPLVRQLVMPPPRRESKAALIPTTTTTWTGRQQ